MESEEFVLSSHQGLAEVIFNGQSIAVPGLHNGLLFEKVQDWIFIEGQGVGFNIRWNIHGFLVITLSPVLWGRTLGLCGSLSGNPYDDYRSASGERLPGLAHFIDSWSLTGAQCSSSSSSSSSSVSGSHPCEPGSEVEREAGEFCQELLEREGLGSCYSTLNPLPYYETCRWTFCQAGHDLSLARDSSCQSVEAFVRACREEGVQPLDWRSHQFCREY